MGAELIFVPAQWGKARKEHFHSLIKALAISNQAFVLACDSANDSMAKGSAIVSPFGEMHKSEKREVISAEVDFNEVIKMRKYINVGLQK